MYKVFKDDYRLLNSEVIDKKIYKLANYMLVYLLDKLKIKYKSTESIRSKHNKLNKDYMKKIKKVYMI